VNAQRPTTVPDDAAYSAEKHHICTTFAQPTPHALITAAAPAAAAAAATAAVCVAHMVALEQGVQQALGAFSSSIPQVHNVRLHSHSQHVKHCGRFDANAACLCACLERRHVLNVLHCMDVLLL
jgi:hypothetical protein